MTYAELYRSTAQLGFEDSLEDDDRFLYSANRALLQVNALRPQTSSCLIHHAPMRNIVPCACFDTVTVCGELIYDAVGAVAYSFEAIGNGVAYIECFDDAADTWQLIGVVRMSTGEKWTLYRGFIERDGEQVPGLTRIRFGGEYVYSVRCVAMYDRLWGPKETDIPAWEPYSRYDISEMVSDFLSLDSPPIKEVDRVRLGRDYDIENGRIVLLPYDLENITLRVSYHRRPAQIATENDLTEDHTVIDLDDELCALLPLLIASMIWIDDEPEKAQYYLAVYQSRANDIEQKTKNYAPVVITNNGW